jgi:hypothetical protein
MLALLRQVRDLRAHGANVEVLAFDPAPSQYRPGDTRDRLVAENLRTVHAAFPNTALVVLVGSYHAKRSPALASNTLSDFLESDSVLALRMQHAGGTAWVCRGKIVETLACGSVEFESADDAIHDHPTISLGPEIEAGFDGIFYVGRIDASPPAFKKGSN